MILATARPTALITLPSANRTIILAIDVSLSMRASDVQPTRLDAAQAAARDFVREPPGDVRSGIIVALAALFPKEGIDVESFAPGARPRPKELPPVKPGSNSNADIILITD